MSTTALLVRWSGGFIEVTQPGATVREEGFFSAGTAVFAADAIELAEAVLDRVAQRDEKITVTVEGAFPAAIGQTLTAPDSTGAMVTWRVVGIAYTHDREGNVIRSPQLELVT